MNINSVIKLWYDSKYNYLFITNLPVVNSDKEIVCPVGIFKKNSKIMFGCELDIIDYLKKIYINCLFIFDSNTDSTLRFKVIDNLDYFY